VASLAKWVATELGPDGPLHFSAYHPAWKYSAAPATSSETLRRARGIARDAGLRYVYTGNVHDREGDTTQCPGCGKPLIQRDWYDILDYALDDQTTDRCQAVKTMTLRQLAIVYISIRYKKTLHLS
jgi:pyruvate formate lyase activating enzyme